MSHLEVPRFPRGFLLADRPVDPPPTFVAGPILEHFYVHPWTRVEAAGDRDLFVIVLGHCVPTRLAPEEPPAKLLACLQEGEETFLEALNTYSGRHAIIFGSAGNIRVVNDATAMRSVFYAKDGGVVASHALLVERAISGRPVKSDLVFAYGYPGNRTPYPKTRILTPNTYYWLSAHVVRRFWPLVPPLPRTADSVVSEVLEAASSALRNMSRSASVKMALTAGLDSRVILAVALNSGIDFEAYTYGTNKATALDRAFARDLAAHMGIRHTLVAKREKPDCLQSNLNEANYSSHHSGAVPGLMHYFDLPDTVALTGNLLEIGRSFYKKYRDDRVSPPVDADSMTNLHYQSMTPRTKASISDYGLQRYTEASHEAFQGFLSDTGYDLVSGLIDPFDQFYWEHRMGVWHGPALLERDFYGVAFIPFNSRRIFTALLGVSQAERDESSVFYRLIESVEPALLQLPVNPKRWPPK